MLNYAVFTQLNDSMLGMSRLTQAFASGAGKYAEETESYLKELQRVTDEHKLPLSADCAVAIQKLESFTGASVAAVSMVRRNARKEKDAFAVGVLDGILKELKQFLAADTKTYAEASDLWRQVAARLLAKDSRLKNTSSAHLTDAVLAEMRSDAELTPYYTHLVGLVGLYNARAVLDTVLPQLM